VRDILAPIARPLVLAPLCFGAAFAVERATDGMPAILQLVLGVAAGVVPLLASLAIPAYRRDLAQIVGFVKQVRKPARTAPASDAAASGSAEPDELTGESSAAARSDVDEVILDDAELARERKAEP